MKKYNTNKEVWKDVIEYEGYYQVSNLGRVKALKRTLVYSDGRTVTRRERVRKPLLSRGYLLMCLSKKDSQKYFAIHRLVADAFLENPNNLPQVNHIDENRLNNKVSNLEWVTPRENNTHGTRIERMLRSRGKNKTKHRKVNQICLETNKVLKTHESISSAARSVKASYAAIASCCRKTTKTSFGFKWEFVN